MVTIKRIGVGSAFRVGMIVGGLLALIFGLLFIALPSLFLTSLTGLMMSVEPGMRGSGDAFAAFTTATMCIIYIVNIVFSAIFGGITAAVSAVAYNLASRWVGGLEVELQDEDIGKSKRAVYYD